MGQDIWEEDKKKVKEIAKVLEYQLNLDERYSYGAYPCYDCFSIWDIRGELENRQ